MRAIRAAFILSILIKPNENDTEFSFPAKFAPFFHSFA